jgi:Ca2+-binding RTX toxin-like protein
MAGPGADRVDGGRGRDTFSGGFLHADGFTVNLRLGTATGGGTGAVGDTVVSIANIDGSADDDVLIGDQKDNVIFAGPGDDDMWGGAGDDDLDGHVDRDKADGGPGTDTCVAETKDRCEP